MAHVASWQNICAKVLGSLEEQLSPALRYCYLRPLPIPTHVPPRCHLLTFLS
jgi:hypothetical protein